MNRRKFLKIAALTAGATIVGGGAFNIMFKDSDPLSPFYDATRKVYHGRFGDVLAATLFNETKQAYVNILPEVPYIGGKENVFAFDRGLVRYKTIAEGAEKCDFRFKKGRKTFVFPLRKGWPPHFLDSSTDML